MIFREFSFYGKSNPFKILVIDALRCDFDKPVLSTMDD
jgi:hypothetical protein